MSRRWRYRAYGLDIASELRLPELEAGGSGEDVVVRVGRAARPATDGRWLRGRGRDVRLSYDGVGTIRVRGGREIAAFPAPGGDGDLLGLYVTGVGLGVVLHQRGLLVLHASAVDVGGAVVAFLGGPRWGKSTAAAALVRRGHGLVADDILAVELEGEEPRVRPGFPQLRLWPDAAAALGHDPRLLPTLAPTLEKRAARAASFDARPRPLGRLYVLDPDLVMPIEPLGAQQRVIELVRHSYLAPLVPELGESGDHLRRCARLAGRSSMARLRRRPALSELAALAEAVEADVADVVFRG